MEITIFKSPVIGNDNRGFFLCVRGELMTIFSISSHVIYHLIKNILTILLFIDTKFVYLKNWQYYLPLEFFFLFLKIFVVMQ